MTSTRENTVVLVEELTSRWKPLPVLHVFRDREQALDYLIDFCAAPHATRQEVAREVFSLEGWNDPHGSYWARVPDGKLPKEDHTGET